MKTVKNKKEIFLAKIFLSVVIIILTFAFTEISFAAVELFAEGADGVAIRLDGMTVTLDSITVSRDYNIDSSVSIMRNCDNGNYRFYMKNLNWNGGTVVSVDWLFYNDTTGVSTDYLDVTTREGTRGFYIDINIPDGGAEYSMHAFINIVKNGTSSRYRYRAGNGIKGHPAVHAYLAHYHTEGAAATCTTAQTCTKCGAILANALGHSMGGWYISANETCTANGQNRRDCQRRMW